MFLAASALAQNPAPPAFEVASVKINQLYRQDDRMTWRPMMNVTPDGLTITNMNLRMIASWAHDMQRAEIAGPDWVDVDRYDIQAKAGRKVSVDELKAMTRALLEERFRMKCHREKRTVEVMALLAPKGGHKMKESAEAAVQSQPNPGGAGATVRGARLADFMVELSRELTVPLVDQTGLTGRFDFAINPQKYVEEFRSAMMTDPNRPTEEQARVILLQNILAGDLGLKLEPRKAEVEFLVIDSATKTPVEN